MKITAKFPCCDTGVKVNSHVNEPRLADLLTCKCGKEWFVAAWKIGGPGIKNDNGYSVDKIEWTPA